MYRSCQGHTQNEQLSRTHRLGVSRFRSYGEQRSSEATVRPRQVSAAAVVSNASQVRNARLKDTQNRAFMV